MPIYIWFERFEFCTPLQLQLFLDIVLDHFNARAQIESCVVNSLNDDSSGLAGLLHELISIRDGESLLSNGFLSHNDIIASIDDICCECDIYAYGIDI